ncbi:hypothetical protein GQ42DRAFT_127473 [Ramicandelaber brevisporus]|nr:hypothetical protein GQ42DRAFT_127473 [Ramicandelaber brevisporus]
MPLLQSFYFNHLLLLSDATKQKFVDALVKMLSDEQVDLRQIAAVTLTDIIKCSPASLLTDLLDKFIVRCKKPTSTSGKEVTPEFYALAIRRRHSAVLGLASLVMAHPYDIPDWMPEALMLIAGAHADPSPIDVTVKRVFAEFKRTHSDRWHEDKYKFTSDQRDMLTDMLVSPSYYA